MSTVIRCPFCNQRYDLDRFQDGAEVGCQQCGNRFNLDLSLVESNDPPGQSPASPSYPESTSSAAARPEQIRPNSSLRAGHQSGGASKSTVPLILTLVVESLMCAILLLILFFLVAVVTEKTSCSYSSREIEGTELSSRPHCRLWLLSEFAQNLHSGEELVAAIPMTETILKNYGNDEYVTGLRSHTRTSHIILIIKKVEKKRFYQPKYWRE